MKNLKKGQRVLIELNGVQSAGDGDWIGNIVGENSEGECTFNGDSAVSSLNEAPSADTSVFALARIHVAEEEGAWVNFAGGESGCWADNEAIHLEGQLNDAPPPPEPEVTIESFDNSIVVANQQVVDRLEEAGFKNPDNVNSSALALFINRGMFTGLKHAHEEPLDRSNYILPSDVMKLKPLPVKVSVEFEVTREQANEIIEDDVLSDELDDLVVGAIKTAVS